MTKLQTFRFEYRWARLMGYGRIAAAALAFRVATAPLPF